MKKLITLICCQLGLIYAASAQPTGNTLLPPAPVNAFVLFERTRFLQFNDSGIADKKAELLTKSRNQKTGAWVMMGLGCAAIIGGIAIEAGNSVENTYAVFADESTNNTGIVIAAVGAGMALGSIPLLIASSKNKRNAKLMVNYQRTGFGVPAGIARKIPGISLVIPTGR